MSFTFGFSEEDLNGESVGVVTAPTTSSAPPAPATDAVSPKVADISNLLLSLIGTSLSFETACTPNNNIVYKRALYDIKHQVMTEDNEELASLLLADDSDLKKNYYEGGFKVWECSFDMIDELHTNYADANTVVELGSGTSLPSCYVLFHRLTATSTAPLKLILSDFNYEVLRLVTVPNLLINWYVARKQPTASEFRITAEVVAEFETDLAASHVELVLISGSWGERFLQLVQHTAIDLVVTCETIYSLESLPVLSTMVIELVKRTRGAKALVGAKNYYFGVGGSVAEFVRYVKTHSDLEVTVREVSSQLKRSVVEVTQHY
ncbi:hypothetical protein CANTEDRAFT_128933 [Yamadazyma tenuis ATCC 10573]|nr:uncharacterized protein CANTEDRAFT_128933 [Yamadazyma tenuis ATCC 10573]EGV66533.1 hypothetical protein CANTEDRAFT_128933 [Yamadazyma tenuis ATCC 10573]